MWVNECNQRWVLGQTTSYGRLSANGICGTERVCGSVYQQITENNDTITDFWTDNLLELILWKDNLNKAYKKVKPNKGKGGIDGMQMDGLLPYLKGNQSEMIQKIKEGKYKPNPVRRVEIPKEEKGKARKLGIPTVVDRLIQQAVTQELTTLFEPQFSENSYGY